MILFRKLLFLKIFFVVFSIQAQKYNQFDANGKRNGAWKKYYANKRIRYTGQFKNGKEVGTFQYYDVLSSKHPTAIKEFSSKSDSASVQFFTTDGVLRSKGMMLGKKRIGKWVYYFTSGKVFSEEFYVDGKLEGEVKTYYNNQVLFETCFYKNGLKNGIMKRYSDQNILLEQVFYSDGKLNGEAKYFDMKGNLKEKGVYKNNKRIGKWEFYLDGELVSEKKKKETTKFSKSEILKKDKKTKN